MGIVGICPSWEHLQLISEYLDFQNVDAMLQSKLQLEVLAINSIVSDHNIFPQLKALRKQGFYQRIHLDIQSQEILHSKPPLDGLELLEFRLGCIYDPITLTVNKFSQVKYLNLGETYCLGSKSEKTIPADFELIAKSFPILERVVFVIIKSEMIKTFIKHSANLQAIVSYHLVDNLNLLSLNEEREKRFRARKITIHLKENEYLSTKWSNGSTNLEFITLRRFESYTKPLFTHGY